MGKTVMLNHHPPKITLSIRMYPYHYPSTLPMVRQNRINNSVMSDKHFRAGTSDFRS
jgi:hypothetical protein